MKKTLKIITITATTLLFVLAFYIMVFGSIARKNNELLNFFGYSYSFVPTDSMAGTEEDSFEANSLIITKKTPFANLNINDVIVYQAKSLGGKDILIVHRIIRENEDGSFVTKGDNPNSTEDSVFVTEDNYQAKMIKSYKMINFGNNINSFQIRMLFVLIVILVVFTIYQIFNIVKNIKKDKLNKIKEEEQKLLAELKEQIKEEIEKEKEK